MQTLIVELSLLLGKLFLLPFFLIVVSKDLFFYILRKGWRIFEGWGLHIYVGRFGAGKTSTMVHDAYRIAKKYKSVSILTNFKLMHFPAHTKIYPLKSPQDILNAPDNTLVLIDEIGTIFNSRDYAKSKESVPKILFQHLCQCRKRHLMIYATSQRWNFVDKQLRDIVATVRKTVMSLGHPFSRMGTVRYYDSVDYDRTFNNPLIPIASLVGRCYIQTDRLRAMYDTSELVENMLTMEYLSDEEILGNQGYSPDMVALDRAGKRALRKGSKVTG